MEVGDLGKSYEQLRQTLGKFLETFLKNPKNIYIGWLILQLSVPTRGK